MKSRRKLIVWMVAFIVIALSAPANADTEARAPSASLLASGLAGATGSGSTIGPDGALYVSEGVEGRIARVDLGTGDVTTFASGLPASVISVGGAMDVAFIDDTAYALVTLVGPFVGGNDVVGIYRIDGPDRFTVIADLGAWSSTHPPTNNTDYFVPSGVPYAMEAYRGGFLVTDGHHGRVLYATLDGTVEEVISWPDIVPTGLEIRGSRIYVAQAGPVPHEPEDGRIVTFNASKAVDSEVASGARLLVDVEFGRGSDLYGLSQGFFTPGNPEGSPANPDTGSIVRANRSGGFDVVIDGLDRPTSFEIVRDTAYVVTLGGEVWEVDIAPRPPYGWGG